MNNWLLLTGIILVNQNWVSAKIRCYDESQSFLTVSKENLFLGSG